MTFHIRQTCQLCRGAIAKVLDLGETPLANEYPREPSPHQDRFPLFIAACEDCGHIQMPVVVDPERLFRDYAYVSGTTVAFREHLAALTRSIVNRCELAANDLVVDIGSNDGTLLEEFRSRGHRVLGVDPALNLAAQATAANIPTLPAFFNHKTADAIVSLAGHADVVTALNVFAHADDLGAIAAGVSELLAEDGTFVIEVGAASSVIDGIFDLIYAEHLAYWSLGPMARFLDKHGLCVRAAETVASQGGSMRVWVGHKTSANDGETEPPKPSVDWAEVRGRTEQKRNAIRDAVLSHGRVGIYGVPAKATTLIHHCGLTGAIVAGYDDNPLKIGRYLPGSEIEIRPVSRMYEDGIDALLLCAWNFADEIIAKRSAWRGKWLVPFPELRVI